MRSRKQQLDAKYKDPVPTPEDPALLLAALIEANTAAQWWKKRYEDEKRVSSTLRKKLKAGKEMGVEYDASLYFQ